MSEESGKLSSSTAGFLCGLMVSVVLTGILVVFYDHLPMPDSTRFYLFSASLFLSVIGGCFALAGSVTAFFFSRERRRWATALGVGFVTFVAFVVGGLAVLGRVDRPLELVAVGVGALIVSAGSSLTTYGITYLRVAALPIGFPLVLLMAVSAWVLHATRATDYPGVSSLRDETVTLLETPLSRETTNVMLITIDTLRADHIPVYGYDRDTAPQLTKLSEMGIVFDHAISQKVSTAPSLATILTGTYPPTHRLMENRGMLDDSNITLTELLQSKGYRTAGATGNPGLGKAFNLHQGFEEYLPLEIKGKEAVYRVDPEEARLLNEVALPLLSEIKDDRFFVWLHYMDPHKPYIVPPAYREIYSKDDLADEHRGALAPENDMYEPIQSSHPFYNNNELDFYISQYDAEIRYLDDKLGQLFDQMTALDLWRNTLVIITADHGESLQGEHRGVYFGHRNPYDHTIHVPLVLIHPDLPNGKRIESAVSLVDIHPTVLSLLGLPQNPVAQGQDLAPLILGEQPSPSRAYQFSIGTGRSGYRTKAIRTDRYKLLTDFYRLSVGLDAIVEGLGRLWVPEEYFNPYHYRIVLLELYDLSVDPLEERNVADENPEVVAELQGALWEWIDASFYEGSSRESRQGDFPIETEEALRALGYIE